MEIPVFIRKRAEHLLMLTIAVMIFVAGFALGTTNATSAAQTSNELPADVEGAFDYFWQTFNFVRSEYIEEVDVQTLVEGATNGMIEALDDQFSGYMTPESFDMINEELQGEIRGIGVSIRTNEDTGKVEVVGLLDGSPAIAVGILPGDIFVTVDGDEVADMTQMELAQAVRGEEGTIVRITMQRGDDLIDFEIVRARIIIPNVEYEIVDGDYAYLRLNQFSIEARRDMDAALEAMEIENRRGLILDFRDNPGGLLSSAIEVASLLIDGGAVVVEDFGDGREQTFNAVGNALNLDIPVVLLVNPASASASELVAGAWQDTGDATILGETTFGKGTVQTWHPLVNGGGLRLTIARWLTPERRWIHDQGVVPDIIVEWERTDFSADAADPQLDAAIRHLDGVLVENAAAVEPAN
ncbi:MAG: S41 family peptidase [Chloroflexota bacterium]|nr:S41 family peptidase [Chloroflexota bacterium]